MGMHVTPTATAITMTTTAVTVAATAGRGAQQRLEL
ncbi:hypothetical protein DES53_104312 [Roseimicrobium gellanilyticum]|uniref:Uncharacterized protein n=1 Tax=Roseimicrobium gellanilyticum TaxID=748857 RepID=A0A366HPP1_9BACT|nr:hypothetical protein DES53_104312 [Roseimicrobium gellanilyticum]